MIHQYINNGYHIVLDVNSGSVHSVDALLYDAVEVLAKIVPDMEKPMPLTDDQKKAVREALVCKYSAEDIEDALSDIQELINAEELRCGYLQRLCDRFQETSDGRKGTLPSYCP